MSKHRLLAGFGILLSDDPKSQLQTSGLVPELCATWLNAIERCTCTKFDSSIMQSFPMQNMVSEFFYALHSGLRLFGSGKVQQVTALPSGC